MKRILGPLAILAAGVIACLLLEYWPHVRDEFFVLLGSRDETGGWYGFNSGTAGAFYMSVIPAGLLLYWHSTCHDSPWCLRIAKYEAAGGVFKVCRHHHPDMREHTGTRRELIRRMHREWQERAA